MTPTTLVTGGSGLIGGAVVEQLADLGQRVVSIDIREPTASPSTAEGVVCDILDADALGTLFQETRPDYVIHLAARTDLDESNGVAGYRANTQGTKNVLDAVSAARTVRCALYTSTQLVCEVGYTPSGDADYCPTTSYGESKVAGEHIVREGDGGGVPWLIARPTTVWGPHMNDHYRTFLKHVAGGTYFHVGSRPLRKSYGYVGNVAHQLIRLVTAPAADVHGKVFYVCDYEPLVLQEYADALAAALGVSPPRTLPLGFARFLAWTGDRLGQAGWRAFPFTSFRLNNILTEYIMDVRNTQEVVGALPFSFDQGIAATAEWFRT